MKPRGGKLSRYETSGNERQLSAIGIPTSSKNISPSIVAVQNPYDAHERVLATVNRQVDILESHRAHGWISEAAYRSGRLSQGMFERCSRSGPGMGSQWREGDRVDVVMAHDLAISHSIDDARKIIKYIAWLVKKLGPLDTELLRNSLNYRMSLRECAAKEAKYSDYQVECVGKRFREALELLARQGGDLEAWT